MTSFEGGSFRDRSARVVVREDGVFRLLNDVGLDAWKQVSQTSCFQQGLSAGRIVGTRELSREEAARLSLPMTPAAVLLHDRVPFVSYPYEWSFGMLRQAALLHLQLLDEALSSGLMLKDASPYNVQFCGTHSVFIDVGSFIPLVPGEPWSAYRQFCELMLFPLLLQAYRGVDFQPLLRGELEGISARRFLQWLSWRDLLRPGVFANGWLQAKLEGLTPQADTSTVRDLKSSGFSTELIRRNIAKLTRLIERLTWQPGQTVWTNYRTEQSHVIQDGEVKAQFVRDVCKRRKRSLVWDLGCNDGRFSRIAAEAAQNVVAMDSDHGCVERLFQSLDQEDSRTILPLCIDLANQSPSQGWRGRERMRLEQRGRPNLVLCLGLIHHLVIGRNIPLEDVVGWLAELGGEVVIEFPSKRDAMVRALLRNKQDQYDDYTSERLAAALSSRFEIHGRMDLPSGERTLYHAIPSQIRQDVP